MTEIMHNTEPTIATPALTELAENDTPIIWYIDRNPTPSIIDLQRLVDNNIPNYDVYYNYANNNYNYANNNYNYYFDNRLQVINNLDHNHPIDIICESLIISDEAQNCCICMETREKQEICLLNCNHGFCGICVKDILTKQNRYPKCALCREKISVIRVQTSETQNNLQEYCV